MGFTSLVSRVYLGFIFLISVMLAGSWFSYSANNSVTSRIETITEQSTPVMMRASQLTISFLDINRSVTPYLFANYIDELEPLRVSITSDIEKYQHHINWLKDASLKNELLNSHLDKIENNNQEFSTQLEKLLDAQFRLLDAKDISLYSQSRYQQLSAQISESMMRVYSKASNDVERKHIEALIGQINLLLSEVNAALAMTDGLELPSEIRSINNRKTYFNESLELIKKEYPKTFKSISTLMDNLSQQVYGDNGSVQLHSISLKLMQLVNDERDVLNNIIDRQLKDIESLAEMAGDAVGELSSASIKESSNINRVLSIIAFVSVVFSIIIGFSFAKMIRNPSVMLSNSLDRIIEKDLSTRINYRSNNEFGIVAKKVNKVTDHLAIVITQLKSSAQKLTNASLENEQISEQLNTDIHHQTEEVTHVSQAINDIANSIDEIAVLAQTAQEVTVQAVEHSESGQAMMKENRQWLEKLSINLNKSSGSIQKLAQESSSIESILDVIRGISEQTNLLALNAAIEAARAGENGRGFSVVADEVRVLAAKTTSSTKEIHDKIERLQSSAVNAVSQINQCTNYMHQCVDQNSQVNKCFTSLHHSLDSIDGNSHQIAESTTEHQSVAQEVSRKVNNIHTLALNTAKQAEKLSNHSHLLEEMAESQTSMTSEFKIES